MSDDSIPDGITPEQLEHYLKLKLKERGGIPPSEVIPALNFGGANGGVKDLTIVLRQILEKSEGGNHAVQFIDLAIFCLEKTHELMRMHIKEIQSGVDLPVMPGQPPCTEDERKVLVDQLNRLRTTTVSATNKVYELYARIQNSVMISRLVELRQKLGQDISDEDLFSHLLYGDDILGSLKLERPDMPLDEEKTT